MNELHNKMADNQYNVRQALVGTRKYFEILPKNICTDNTDCMVGYKNVFYRSVKFQNHV